MAMEMCTYVYYAYTSNLGLMLTHKYDYFYLNSLYDCQIKAPGDKHMLATLNYLNHIHT